MLEENINKVDEILELIKKYTSENPNQRFTQILFNLNINQFIKDDFSQGFRDNYNDLDQQVVERLNNRLKDFENNF